MFRDLFQQFLLGIYRKSGSWSVGCLQQQVSRAKMQQDARQIVCQDTWRLLLWLPTTPGHGNRPFLGLPAPVPALPQQCQPAAPSPFLPADDLLDGLPPPTGCAAPGLRPCLWLPLLFFPVWNLALVHCLVCLAWLSVGMAKGQAKSANNSLISLQSLLHWVYFRTLFVFAY